MAKKGVLKRKIKKSQLKKYIHPEIMREGNISLILEEYNDLFSDFDPREYSERALSEDFIEECKRASRDKPADGSLELRLLIPNKKRNLAEEKIIGQRLNEHFKRHFERVQKDGKKIKKRGIIWTMVGWILLFLSGVIYLNPGIFYQLLFVVFNPAGWFTMWTGFDMYLSNLKEEKPEFEFYKKMANMNIYFFGY